MSELSKYSIKELKELRSEVYKANEDNPAWIRDREVGYIDKELKRR